MSGRALALAALAAFASSATGAAAASSAPGSLAPAGAGGDPWARSLLSRELGSGSLAGPSAEPRARGLGVVPRAPDVATQEDARDLGSVLPLVDRLLRRGAAEEALRLLDAAVVRLPAEARLHRARGVVLERLGRETRARAAYRSCLQLAADDAGAMAALGSLLVDEAAEQEEGERLLRSALDRDPRCARALDGLGWLKLKKGDPDGAAGFFERARQADPSDPSAAYHLGLLALRRKDLARAMAQFQAAAEADPGHDRARISLGLLYEQLGERAKARRSLEEALRLVRGTVAVERRIVAALRRLDPLWHPELVPAGAEPRYLGLPAGLLPAPEPAAPPPVKRPRPRPRAPAAGPAPRAPAAAAPRVLDLRPEAREGGGGAGPSPLPAEAMREAVVVSRSMVQRDLVGIHLRLGKVYVERGLLRDAAGEFQTVINLGPLASEAREAKELLDGLVDIIDPSDDEKVAVYMDLGNEYYRRGDLESAKLHYKKVLLLQPATAEAQKNLAYVFLREGKEAEAWSHLEEALRAQPDFPEALALKGYVLARRRSFVEAEAAYLRAASLSAAGSSLERYAREMAEKMSLFTDLK